MTVWRTMKPNIKLVSGVWQCNKPWDVGYVRTGFGLTPEEAYGNWLIAEHKYNTSLMERGALVMAAREPSRCREI